MSLLQLKSVCAGYGPIQVLRDVSIEVAKGGVTALLGSNGAGKTTTLRTISGVVKPMSGEILFAERPLAGLTPSSIASRGIGHVPDGRGTIAELTTEENLRVGGWKLRNRHEVEEELERTYTRFPVLKERRKQQAGTLSGGEQQMLAIGRALMPRPRLLLLDEPSFGVAPLVVARIFGILRQIMQEHGIAILLIEQNAKLALDLADNAYVLESGRITLQGPACELKNNEDVRRSYLGA